MNVTLHAPDWARWMAQNESGWWFFYKDKPRPSAFQNWWFSYEGSRQAYLGEPNPDWRNTLHEVY